jgi:chemotaxis protein methyltransferase CheR
MTMLESLGTTTSARLLATDIDTNVLATARRAVYRLDAARNCGEQRLKQFFLRGTGANDGMVRVKPELTKLVEFAPLNLLEANWTAQKQFSAQLDVVFIRNVMIYFDKPTQRQILERLAAVIRKGGLLMIGHSENFTDHREIFALRGKTVYERV